MSVNIYDKDKDRLINIGGGSGVGVDPDAIAPEETSPTTSAYSVGDYFMYGNKLCVASAAILVGDTLVEGTNYIVTNVTDSMQGLIDANSVDNLNSTSATKALSANMGNRLANDLGTPESTDVAQYAHAVGEFFVNSTGKYVKVTSAISVGDNIVISGDNANVTETTVSAELSELNSEIDDQGKLVYINITNQFTVEEYINNGSTITIQTSYRPITGYYLNIQNPNNQISGAAYIGTDGIIHAEHFKYFDDNNTHLTYFISQCPDRTSIFWLHVSGWIKVY